MLLFAAQMNSDFDPDRSLTRPPLLISATPVNLLETECTGTYAGPNTPPRSLHQVVPFDPSHSTHILFAALSASRPLTQFPAYATLPTSLMYASHNGRLSTATLHQPLAA